MKMGHTLSFFAAESEQQLNHMGGSPVTDTWIIGKNESAPHTRYDFP